MRRLPFAFIAAPLLAVALAAGEPAAPPPDAAPLDVLAEFATRTDDPASAGELVKNAIRSLWEPPIKEIRYVVERRDDEFYQTVDLPPESRAAVEQRAADIVEAAQQRDVDWPPPDRSDFPYPNTFAHLGNMIRNLALDRLRHDRAAEGAVMLVAWLHVTRALETRFPSVGIGLATDEKNGTYATLATIATGLTPEERRGVVQALERLSPRPPPDFTAAARARRAQFDNLLAELVREQKTIPTTIIVKNRAQEINTNPLGVASPWSASERKELEKVCRANIALLDEAIYASERKTLDAFNARHQPLTPESHVRQTANFLTELYAHTLTGPRFLNTLLAGYAALDKGDPATWPEYREIAAPEEGMVIRLVKTPDGFLAEYILSEPNYILVLFKFEPPPDYFY